MGQNAITGSFSEYYCNPVFTLYCNLLMQLHSGKY